MNKKFIEQLKRYEGFRRYPYLDSVGKLTIGYGTNLEDKGIDKKEGEFLLLNDVENKVNLLLSLAPWVNELDQVRKEALFNMAYNLGVYGLLKFKRMLKALKEKNYKKAADEALNSRWAMQVGYRAIELSEQIKTGEYLFKHEICM